MGAGVKPELQNEEDPLSAYRQQRDAVDPLTAYRQSKPGGSIVLPPGDTTSKQKPMRLRPVVVTKPEEPPAPPPVAQSDVTRVGPEPVGLEERLRNEHPTLLDATVQGVKGMAEHPIDAGIALAETPFKGGQAVGEYVKGGRLNKGKGRAAAIGAAQTGAMLLGGPAEKFAEPVVARLAGEAAAPFITRTAVGAATGATFTPDRPAVGAIIGGAAGAASSRGVAAAKLAERQAKFDAFAKQYPEWFGESTPAEAETRQSRLLANPNATTATARVVEQPPSASAEPDFTVGEPNAAPSPIEVKGVFGGALEQHGQDYAAGKVASPVPATNEVATTPNPVVAPAKLPDTVEATDEALASNGARYSTATDPAERKAILQLQSLLEDHRESLAPKTEHEYSSTQLDLPPETAAAVKQLGESIPDEHLAEDGREDNPHITVKYGLHGEDPEAVRELLANEPPVTVKLGKTSFFPNGESDAGDVLKVDVDSPALHRLNKKIADALPHTDTHPTYKPHATVAYLKPGLGKKYAGDESLSGHTVTLNSLTFSDKNGVKTEIPLGGKPKKTNGKGSFTAEAYRGTGRVARPSEAGFGRFYSPNKDVAAQYGEPKKESLKFDKPLRVENWVEAKKDLTLEPSATMDDVLKAAAKSGFDGIVFANHNGAPEYVDLKEPPAPVHETARVPSGGLRDNLETVKTDGLIKEMFALLGAEDPSDSMRAIYRTVEADVSGTQFGVMIQAATRKGNGPSEQAKALHRMELKKGVAGRIERILNDRGMSDKEITHRYAELSEIETERTAELEGMDNEDRGDTSFDFPKEGYTNEHGEGAGRATAAERTHAAAESEAAGSAGNARSSERAGPPATKGEADEVSRERARPERNGYDQAVQDLWQEAGTNGRLELLDQWRRLYPEQEFFPEWADRPAEDLPAHVRDKIGMERVKQAVALKDLGALERSGDDWTAPNEKPFSPVAKGLANGAPLGEGTQMYDTDGNASRATLDKLAQRPHTRQLATRFMTVFDQIHAAIAKRYTFEPVRFGGFDVSMGVVGMNVKPRAGGGNFILLNPYSALMEVGLSGRLRPSEYAAALSERAFATMVHEIAHQAARGHDELFSSYLTRYAGAAAPIAHLVLPELDQAWQVALENGFKDDLVTVQHEVWNHELERHITRPGSDTGTQSRLSRRGDADASYLRSSEADGGVGEGDAKRRRRLGERAQSDVRGGAARSEGAGRAGAGTPGTAARQGRHAETPGGVESELPARLPEPSGLTRPRSNIRPAEFVRALRAFLNPEALGPEARAAAGTIRHQSAEAYHRLIVSTHGLDKFKAKIDKLPRLEQVKLWDNAEHGRPLGDPELEEGNRLLRQATEARTKQLVAFDRLKAEKTIENYIGRFWSKTTSGSGRDFLRAIMGRRPFEGPKSFLRARDLDWFIEGLKRADLVPATYNYVESQLAKLAEMERVISAEHTLRQEEKLGRAQRVMLGAEPPVDAHGDNWVKIDPSGEDPAFVVYLPPVVPHWEAVDTMVYGKLRKLIDELNVEHVRSPKIGGSRLGFAEGDQRITTKFGGAEGVVMHELGHILDARYGLGDEIDRAIGKAPRRKVTKGKRAGQEVPDYKSEGKDAAQRRQALREELRQLANLRRETMAGVPATKELGKTDRQYLHSREEKMANMVEAYIAARDRFRRVAPGIFEIFDRIVQDHPELHTLRDIEPSLSREEHGSSTRVPGIITGGHWYAPRDAAAVWQNHLSKGLAGNPIYDAAIAPVHAGTQMLLGFSGFHGTVIATEGAFSDLALAIDNLANKGGDLSQIPKQIARAGVSPMAGVTFGRKVMQEYRIPGTHPELKEVLDAMIAGGFRGRATSELWSGDRKERLKVAFREALHAEAKGRRLWGAARLPVNSIWAGVEMASGPLMSKYVPLMKTAATYNAVAQALEKLPLDTSIDELHRVMGDIVKEMDFRFGQVDYDNHFINRVAKDLAQLVFLAPGWTFGTLALAGRGIRDVAKFPVRLAKRATGNDQRAEGEVPPELVGRSAAYWIGAVLGTMLINGTLTYFNTGERPHGKDYWAFRDGTKDDAGNWNRHTVPGYLMHDIYGWSKHPVHTFKNKFAPTLAFFARLAENKDYFGDMIYDPDATLPTKLKQAGKAIVKEHAPLSLQNYLEGKKRGEGGAGELARNAFGVTPARRELVRTEAQNKMADYLSRDTRSRTPDEIGKGEMHRAVIDAVRDGEELPKGVVDAVVSGQLKRATLEKWINGAAQVGTVGQFKRLSLEQATTVWDLANDEEKGLWAQAFRTKLLNANK